MEVVFCKSILAPLPDTGRHGLSLNTEKIMRSAKKSNGISLN
jgi:hypothetical protein